MKCKCGETDPSKFYGTRKWVCGACYNEQNKDRARKRRAEYKKRIVEYFGGGCTRCGYTEFLCNLDIHHLDPTTKSKSFSNGYHGWSWKRIEREISNCTLLCKHCHNALEKGFIYLGIAQPGQSAAFGSQKS